MNRPLKDGSGPAEIDAKIDKLFGQLVRAIDERKKLSSKPNGAYHSACHNALGRFFSVLKEWRVTK